MPSNNQVRIGVGFDIDQTGINKIKSELQSLQKLTEKDLKLQVGQDATKELEKIKSSAAQVESALSRAFNSDLGTLNVAKFNTELKNLNLSKIAQDFSAAGAAGQKCFNDITAKALTSNIQLKQTFSIVEKMRTTLANTIKWQVASSAINSMTSSVQQAFSYVKQLDTALTDIRIVTGDSSEEMAKFAVQANKAAQELGRTTKDYAKAALTYYQQGLGDDEVRARTEATLKAANVTGAAVSEVAEDLTAVWNGYKITTEETTLAVDKLAAVADSSASDLSELATAMSKVASIGNNMGVSIDQLNAQISTIIATTRQAPETVGNALKTIYARINDIVAGTDEAETSLGNYSGQMASLGISVLDSNGKLRDTGEVMEEIGSKWGSMTREQQVYLAKTMAGQRQMNNLIALFDNWTQYQQMINVSMSSAGSLDEKNARYMESIAAHAKSFSAALEGVQDSLIDEDTIKGVYDLGTDLLNLVNQFVKSIGGGRGAILGLSTILTSLFEKQIANGLLTIKNNRQAIAYNEQLIKDKKELLNIYSQEIERLGEEHSVIANNIKAMTELYNVAEQYGVSLDESNQKAIDGLVKEKAVIYDTRAEYQSFLEDLEKRDYTSRKNRAEEDEGGMQTATNLFEKDKLSSVDEEGHLVLDEEKIKQAQSALEEQKNTYENLLGTVKRYQNEASKAQKSEIKNNIEISALNKRIGDQRDVAEEDVKAFVEAEDKRKAAIDDAKNAADNLTSALFEQSKSIPLEQWEKLSSILADQATGDMPYDEFFRKVNQVLREGQVEVEGTSEKLEGLRAKVAETNGDLDELNGRTRSFFDTLKDKAVTESIAGVLKGVSQLTMGLNSLFNIFDTFDQLRKKEISGWEAFTRVVMGASMAIPMLVGGIKSASLGLAGLAGAVSAEAAAAKASAVANGGLIASLKALSTAIYEVPIVGWILAIVSAIIALIAIIAKMKKTADQRLKEHRESISKLKNAYQEATKASQELANSFNEYDSLVDKLNECTKGTKEWATALTEVNNKVLELIEKYPELLQYVERGDNGQLIISEEGQRAFQEQIDKKVVTAQSVSVAASAQGKREEEESVAQEVYTKTNLLVSQEDISYLAEEGYGKTSEELVSLYEEYLKNSYGIENLEEYQVYIDAVRDNSEEIQKLAKTVHENNIATQAETDALAASIVSGNENLNQSGYSKEIAQQISASFEEVNKKTLKELDKNGWGTEGISKFTGVNERAKEVFEEYAKVAGITGATLVDTTGTDSNRKFVYESSEGKRQTVSLDEMRIAKAAADAQQEVEDTAKALVKTLKDLDAGLIGNIENAQAAQGLKSIISREGLLGATTGQREALYKAIVDQGSGFNDETIAAWLDSTFGDGLDGVLSKESLEKLGFTSNAEAVKEIREAYEEATKLEKDIPKQLLNSVKNVYNDLNLDNLVVSQKDIIAKNLEQAFIHGGQEGLENAQEIIEKTIAVGQADEFASVVEGMDFSTVSVQQFRDALDAAGVSAAQFTDTELELYIRSMADAATKTVEELTETYAELTKITSKLSQGDTISAEDYQKLADQGLSHFFDLMLDGTYQLNERAEKLNEILHDTQVDNFREQISARQQQIQDYERISKYDFDTLSTSARSSKEVKEQLDTLQTLGGADEKTIAKWREGLQTGVSRVGGTGVLDNDDLKEIAEAVQEVEGQFKTLDSTIEETTNNSFALEVAIAKSYSNIDDMRAALEEGEFSLQAFNQAVIDLDEITDVENLNPEEFKAFIDYIQDAADDSTLLADSLEDDADAAYIVAKSMMKMNLGVEDLSDNWEDWNDILSNSTIASEEYGEAMESTIEALSNLLDVDSSFVSADFVREHLEDITSAAEGSEEAIDNLRDELKTSIVAKIALQNEIEVSDLESDLQNVQSLLDDLGPLEIGTVVTDGDFLNSCQEMIKNAGMTADQVNALFDSMGFEPTFATEEIPISNTIPVYKTHHQIEGTYGSPEGWDEITSTEIVKEIPADGKMTAFGLSTDGTVPKITGITKKATFASANSSTLNAGGKGKSSSSSKSSKKDKKDPLEDTRDIYHDINIEISDYETSLKRIQTEQEHLTGKGLIKNLQEQVKLLDKQKDAYLRKAELQKQDLINQQKVLAGLGATFDQYGNISNYMSVLGEKQQFVNNLTNQYNNLIDQYNNADETRRESLESQLETLEEQLDIAQKDYDLTEKKIGDYDSLMDDIQEVQDNIQELTNQQIELQIEAFNAEIKVSLDLSQAERDWNEFRKKVINRVADEDYLGLAAATAASFDSYYKTNSTGEVQELTEHLTKITDEVQKMTTGGHSSIYSAFNEQTGLWTNNYSKAQEDLKEYLDKLMSTLENADAVITEVHNNIMSEIAETQEAIDNQKKNYEQIDELINHDIKMLQLLRGEDSYEEMAHYYEEKTRNDIQQVDLMKQAKDMWQAQAAEAQARRDRFEEGTADWERLNAEYEEYNNNYLQAMSDLNSAIEKAIESASEQLKNAIQSATKAMNDSLFGGDYNRSQEEWENQKYHNDRYIDDINRATALLDLQRDINEAITSASTKKAQKELADYRDAELKALKEKEHLTQNDIDMANKRLEIYQKQMALEDAQNAKTNMRLVRDSQGNYTYQYRADEDKVANAQEELEKSLTEYFNMAKDGYREVVDEIYSVADEAAQKLAEVTAIYGESSLEYQQVYEDFYGEHGKLPLLYEEAANRAKDIEDSSYQYLKMLRNTEGEDFASFLGEGGEIQNAINELLGPTGDAKSILDDFVNNTAKKHWDALSEQTKDALIGEDSILSTWNLTINNIADNIEEKYETVVKKCFDDIFAANDQWVDQIGLIEQTSGQTLEKIAEGTDLDVTAVQELLKSNEDLISAYRNELKAINQVGQNLEDLILKYGKARDAAIQAATEAAKAWEDANNKAASYQNPKSSGSTVTNFVGNSSSALSSITSKIKSLFGSGEETSGGGNPDKQPGGEDTGSEDRKNNLKNTLSAFLSKNAVLYADSEGKTLLERVVPSSFLEEKKGKYVYVGNSKNNLPPFPVYDEQGYQIGYVKNLKTYKGSDGYIKREAYEKGGYTGDWAGGYGKPAILHSSEYVLNAKDTPNVLRAVNIARGIMDKVGSINSSMLDNLARTGILTTSQNSNTNTTSQVIEINASFPNANNASEIEQALNNLVNSASQRANKSRRIN